jgi:aryl-alcohol dehydrogenase-like predicted oxidoreductase
MRLTGPRIWGPPADPAEALRVLRRAIDLGVRVIDTAWYYGPDVANELVAEALYPYPDDLVLVTKLGGARAPDASWHSFLRPEQLREGVEHDLRQLRLDAVPIAHLRYLPGADVPFDEALDGILALVEEGKIERIGLSSVTSEQFEHALARTPVATVSNAYSVLDRSDDPTVALCEQHGIAYLPFFPLAASPVSKSKVVSDQSLATIADELGVTTTRLALAWLLYRSPCLLPIPGTSSVAHLEDNLAARELTLPDDVLLALG